MITLLSSLLLSSPVAIDDAYSTVTGDNLSVDAPGVLENDTDADGDMLTAILVDSSMASGILQLFSDGSLEYEPAPGFVGIDVFTYKANDGTGDSNEATVEFTVTVGGGGGQIALTDEATFLNLLSAMNLDALQESFEDDQLWGAARTPTLVSSVGSYGINWASNHSENNITTGLGAAHTGFFGIYSIPHGNYSSAPQCAIPGACADGWKGSSAQRLVAIGGWIRVNAGIGQFSIILDDDVANPVDFGGILVYPGTGWKFFGVVDPAGFNTFEFHETEGKAEDQVFAFGDDFSFAYETSLGLSVPYGSGINPANSMIVVSGAPQLGSIVTLGMDNPLGTQAVGSVAYLSLALVPAPGFPAGVSVPGLGMASPGAPGELLIGPSIFSRVGPLWLGPGIPATRNIPIPNDIILIGLSVYAQGALLDLSPGAAIPIGLTDAVELRVGP